MLVHANRTTPPSAARYAQADVPDDVSRETFDPALHAGWDDLRDSAIAQAFGRTWIQQRRSTLLIVPSVVTAGRDVNLVVNPDHADAARISIGPKTPVTLDPRLFGR
jgi:RES domain-containing protein